MNMFSLKLINKTVQLNMITISSNSRLSCGSVAVAEVVQVVELAFEVVGLGGVVFVGAVVVRLVVDMGAW